MSLLRAAPAGVERVLSESLSAGEPRLSEGLRAASIELLAERRYRPAARVFEAMLRNPTETPEVKAAVLRSLSRLDRTLGARWATRCLGEPGPLGDQAKTMVDPSAHLDPLRPASAARIH